MPEDRPSTGRERARKLEKEKSPKDARKWAKETAAENIKAP